MKRREGKPTARKGATRARQIQSTLADHLAAVLRDPNTPEGIYNVLREELLDAATDACVSIDDPEILSETLPRVLDMLNAQGASRNANQSQVEFRTGKRLEASEEAAASLTPEHVASIVDQWTMSQFHDDESIGDLILVLKAIVFRDDLAEREHVLRAIERVLMPYSSEVSEALHKIASRRLEVQREWRAN
jgi:hypothetical protein